MATSKYSAIFIVLFAQRFGPSRKADITPLSSAPKDLEKRLAYAVRAPFLLLLLAPTIALTLTACGGGATNNTGNTADGPAVDTITMTFTVCIDGRDELIIQGNTLKWKYLDFQPVGASGNCPDNTTLISTTLNGTPVMNAVPWQPMYPTTPISSGEVTLPFTSLSPALPNSPATATLTVIQARDSLTMTEFPSSANGGTMILDFNDDPSPGAVIYSAKVTITVPHSP